MTVTLVQSAFRIRGDNGIADNGVPSWFASQNNVAVPTQGCPFRIRFQIENTGSTDAVAQAWQLYNSRNAGPYSAVTTSSTYVQSIDASLGASSDNSALTGAMLTGGVTTFANGQYDMTGETAAQALAAGGFTEFEFGISFTSNIVAGDTYNFLVYYNNTQLDTYAQFPALSPTVNLPDLAPTAVAYNKNNGQFSANIYNYGPGDTPTACTVSSAFFVDSVQHTFANVTPNPTVVLAATTVTVHSSATGGQGGGAYLIPPGSHSVSCLVDDLSRMTEVTRTNNSLAITVVIDPQILQSQTCL